MPARADTQWLQLRQTEAQLARFRKVALERPPASGWIAAVRQAIGMSVAQLADRLHISRTSVAKMEQREADGGITLDALRRAADALDCDVVYAIVPRAGSLERAVKARADLIAGTLVSRAGHSMSLEAQTVGREVTTAQQQVIARRLLAEWPRDLWDAWWDRRTGDGGV
ncbi:mobile mystery protein A [Gemmatimonas sp.]|uniref:mobile mystery protein A n=1 Tax=Gemmatimonas sp. TaxID=1962908 RepID=UPI00286EABD8|nr:mobile mystery protein A [Gemmatimonas sp.]